MAAHWLGGCRVQPLQYKGGWVGKKMGDLAPAPLAWEGLDYSTGMGTKENKAQLKSAMQLRVLCTVPVSINQSKFIGITM